MRARFQFGVIVLVVLWAVAFASGLTGQAPTGPPVVDALTLARRELSLVAEQLAGARANLAICQGQLAPDVYKQNLAEVTAERTKIVDAFEAAHPGWTLDLVTLAVTKKVPPLVPPKKEGGV